MENKFNQIPVFENGLAQPVFPFTDGKSCDAYDAANSAVVRLCVYVESDYDVNNDGKPDLVRALIQVPRSAAEGNYKAATVFEARPYCAGVNDDGYDHMKEVEDRDYPAFDMSVFQHKTDNRISSACKAAGCAGAADSDKAANSDKDADSDKAANYDYALGSAEGFKSTLEAAAEADPADWYYEVDGVKGSHSYENLDNFNYYLVRGFAVVTCAGFGTFKADGFEVTGSSYERDAFKAVVEWIHGDRVAYTDRSRKFAIRADWSNGKVAMTGRSYAGTMPFAVAVTGVEGLETIIPVAGISDWYSFLNQQGAQRYWPKEMLMSFLSYFCTSKYYDPELTYHEKEQLDAFHHQFSIDQMKHGLDYSDYWTEGNYTLQAEGIKCPALIVHGLHDENVSTKQFEMMLKSFEKAGADVKLILHQGPHITPTMPNKGYGIMVDGQYYDDIVNRWISHFLCGVDNGAEEMPAVLVQSNLDQNVWLTADSWETGKELVLECCSEGAGSIGTDWEAAGINQNNFDEKMSTESGPMNRRYLTQHLDESVTIQGTVRVDFAAALDADPGTASGTTSDITSGRASGSTSDCASLCLNETNVNDADKLSFALSTYAGKMDDIKLTVLLCDLADEEFDSIQTTDAERNVVPEKTLSTGSLPLGGSLAPLDIHEFETQHKTWNVITRAYLDLCNPDAGYEPETAASSVTLVPGEPHVYHAYLNAARYTVAPGHRIAVIIGTEDPVNCLIHKTYSVAIDDSSVKAVLPVTEDAEPIDLYLAE